MRTYIFNHDGIDFTTAKKGKLWELYADGKYVNNFLTKSEAQEFARTFRAQQKFVKIISDIAIKDFK